jgi:hypothetical protein
MHALASAMASSVMCPLTDDDFDHVAAGCEAGHIVGALLDFPAGRSAPADGGQGPAVEFAMMAHVANCIIGRPSGHKAHTGQF